MNDVKTESSAFLPDIQGIKIHIEIFPGNRHLLNRIDEFRIFLTEIVGFLEDVNRAMCSNCILRCRFGYKSDSAIVKVSREYGWSIWWKVLEKLWRNRSRDSRRSNVAIG
jgi:hypothetical protein